MSYPVVMIYPTMGASWFFLDCVQDKVTDLEVNLVTIGLPGGSGTSVTKKKPKRCIFCNPRTDNHVEVSSYSSSLQVTQLLGSVPNLSWKIESTYFEFHLLRKNYVLAFWVSVLYKFSRVKVGVK